MDRDGVTPIDVHLARARARLVRVEPGDLRAELAQGAILVDIRPHSYREQEGTHPAALVIDRNVLEWRLDPASPDRVIDIGPDTTVVVMCNDGYASSLAAAGLLDMGFRRATDLVGGYRAWVAQA